MTWWARAVGGWMIALGLGMAAVGLILVLWNFSSRGGNPEWVARGVWAIWAGVPLALSGMVLEVLGATAERAARIEEKLDQLIYGQDRSR